MNDQNPKEVFLASLDRCMVDEGFISAFYERFLSSSGEVRDKFRSTDFERQNRMLHRSLRLCAGAVMGDAAALQELTARATTHDRHHLNIEPRFYDWWLESIIETASGFDEQWDPSLEASWRQTLGHAIKHLTRRY